MKIPHDSGLAERMQMNNDGIGMYISTVDEMNIIRVFRKLNEEGKDTLLRQVRYLGQDARMQKVEFKLLPFKPKDKEKT